MTSKTQSKSAATKQAEDIAHQVKDQLDETVTKAQDVMQQLSTQANDELKRLTDKSTTFVKDNPGTAIVGAVGLGLLLGLAIKSR